MKKFLLALIILLAAVTLVACGGEEVPAEETPAAVTIVKINVLENSFKSEYVMGETIDYSNAKLLVTYSNGTTKQVNITENMVTDLSTLTAGLRTATVSYGERANSFNYTVVLARFTLSRLVKTNEAGEVTEVGVRVVLEGAGNVAGGVAGLSVSVTDKAHGLEFKEDGVESERTDFEVNYAYISEDKSTQSFIYENPLQNSRISEDGALFTVWFRKTGVAAVEEDSIGVSGRISNLEAEFPVKTGEIINITEGQE